MKYCHRCDHLGFYLFVCVFVFVWLNFVHLKLGFGLCYEHMLARHFVFVCPLHLFSHYLAPKWQIRYVGIGDGDPEIY